MTTITKWALCAGLALAGASALTACSKTDNATSAPSASATSSDRATVPPPPGNSTPKAADSTTRAAVESNEKTGSGGAGQQSTVGTAASGAPPYTLNGAPEGNPTPAQGTKAGDPAGK